VPARVDRPAIYVAMGRFLDVLDEQGSLLSPGRSIWTTSALSDLTDRVVGHPDFGAGSFIDKLVRQTRQASPAVIQLAGEALFVFHLKDAETPATTKRLEIQRILAGLPDPPAIPNDLAEAMESGVARYGLGKLHKWPHFTYLLRFSSRWLELSSNERTRLREDAWAFRDFLEQIKVRAGGFQQDAILHLVHPEVFEPIISRGDKRAIVRAYEDQITEPTSDPDRALQQIAPPWPRIPRLAKTSTSTCRRFANDGTARHQDLAPASQGRSRNASSSSTRPAIQSLKAGRTSTARPMALTTACPGESHS
jgi:5-methylcytosine-specific restriction enzyme B